MTREELRGKLESDPDFIAIKRFNYSLRELLRRYPDGCPDRVIAQALKIKEEEIETIYHDLVQKLKSKML